MPRQDGDATLTNGVGGDAFRGTGRRPAGVNAECGVGMKRVMMTLRYVLTGMDVGAPIGEVIELLGRAETMHRLERFILEEESELPRV